MAVFNAAKREIDLKIVYYGPAMCGKTTNVQCIHKMLAPQQRGELMSLATKDDRTLFFDFLPIELGDVRGFKTRFHIYTVPGQVYYALTRRAVLTGADGVVFVVDSQSNKLQENIESLKDLSENLRFYKKDLSSFPFVLQYNKRDLPNIMPADELNAMLNTLNVPALESSAVTGMGVVETLTTICKIVLKQMDSGTAKKKPPQPSARQAERPVMKDDDSGLRIFAEQQAAPAAMPAPEPAAMPQRPPTGPSQRQAAGLKPAGAAAKKEQPPQEDFTDMMIEQGPAAPAEPGLAFEDGGPAGLDIEEPAAEPDLAFEDEGPAGLDIEEPAAEPELTFEDESPVDLDLEEAAAEPELTFEDESPVDLDIEEPAAEADLTFADNTTLGTEEPEVLRQNDQEDVGLVLEDEETEPELAAEPADMPTVTFGEPPPMTFEEPPAFESKAAEPVRKETPAKVSIAACGQPQKVADAAVRLPLTLKLSNGVECTVTVTVTVDDEMLHQVT